MVKSMFKDFIAMFTYTSTMMNLLKFVKFYDFPIIVLTFSYMKYLRALISLMTM